MDPIDADAPLLRDDPLWYRDAVVYELHVRSFSDSNGDGIGDFAGLTSRLDYLEELGVTALWLLPFYPSPLRDDGYDIAHYRSVHPDYGTLEDFREFLDEAHGRGLRVITELVINHTSDQHPWFQRARRAPPGSPEREFYVWSDDPGRYAEARIIFRDFEPSNWSWDPVAGQYYWHRFYHHQPDLNFESPEVRRELFAILDFWLEMGVDGLRLDAIPYLYEREGTNCENLPETHAFLRELRAHVDRHYSNRMLLAEANQWPEDAAAYFGDGDECHMNFHFPLMPRLFMALRMEDRFPIRDILEQTPEVPEGCQWGLFLRNHDELTLEMVTDEERDYMYRVYAEDPTARINLGIRRRLAPLLNNSRRKIELLSSLLLSLPGTPVLYYGDEIGMGDNFYLGDRHGVRTPMQWAGDRNAGFSRANPQKLFLPVIIDPEYHYEAVNVEAQQRSPSSLLWWMRRVIALRRRHPAFGRGGLEWVEHETPSAMAFLRRHGDDVILVVANLSRFAQPVELRLQDQSGRVPVELFGHTRFPKVGDEPYSLVLAPHGFLWFSLEDARAEEEKGSGWPGATSVSLRSSAIPMVRSEGAWDEVLYGRKRKKVEDRLVSWVRQRRWFAAKGRTVRRGRVTAVTPVGDPAADGGLLVLLEVEYVAADPQTYLLTLARSEGEVAGKLAEDQPGAIVWRVGTEPADGVVHEGLFAPGFCRALLELIAGGARAEGRGLSAVGVPVEAGGVILAEDENGLSPVTGRAEQSNTSVRFGQRWILKLFRRLEAGANPEREVGEFLRGVGFHGTPELAGALELHGDGRSRFAAGVLHRFVPNRGDAWEYTLETLGRYFEVGLAWDGDPGALPASGSPLERAEALLLGDVGVPDEVGELMGPYLESARSLGRVTGELHEALASRPEVEVFRPEPFSTLYQRSLYQSIRSLLGTTLESVAGEVKTLDEADGALARQVLSARWELLGRFQGLLERKFDGRRIRVHGDLHLGQVLHTGRDFQIIDFEGEPDRPLGERRIKRSPLRDVGGMLRSFDYAARTALRALPEQGLVSDPRAPRTQALGRLWAHWSSVQYLLGYLSVPGVGPLLPSDIHARQRLLELFVLEKALYEVRYELNNRPSWVRVPLEGIVSLVASEPSGEDDDG